MTVRSRIFAAIVCLLAVSMCFAQGGGGRQGRGGRGGGTSLMGLAGRADVQADLKISDDQKTKLTALRASMRQNRGGGAGGGTGTGGGGGTGGGQRTPPTDAERAARTAEEEKQLGTVLTPDQVTRLHEIQIQLMGDRAITNPDVQTKLGFTDDQKAKVKDLTTKFAEAGQSLRQKRQDGSMSQEDVRAAMQKNNQAIQDELHKVLTSEQADKLKALGGKHFEAAPPSGGGGG